MYAYQARKYAAILSRAPGCAKEEKARAQHSRSASRKGFRTSRNLTRRSGGRFLARRVPKYCCHPEERSDEGSAFVGEQILRGACPERESGDRSNQSRSFAALRMTRKREGPRMTKTPDSGLIAQTRP